MSRVKGGVRPHKYDLLVIAQHMMCRLGTLFKSCCKQKLWYYMEKDKEACSLSIEFQSAYQPSGSVEHLILKYDIHHRFETGCT